MQRTIIILMNWENYGQKDSESIKSNTGAWSRGLSLSYDIYINYRMMTTVLVI